MEPNSVNQNPPLHSSGSDANNLDPLLEQMRSMLQLGPRACDLSQRRERRFSDADRPRSELPFAKPEAIAIRSRDGSRWLPAPDEQSHKVGSSRSTNGRSTNNSTKDAHFSHPLNQHTCASVLCAVTKVFETTELLELILSFLETRDILRLRLTSREWSSTIHRSPQLRLHFFTYGQWSRPGALFHLLPLNIPGLTIELGKEIHLGRWITITFTSEAARRIAPDPKPSRRVRSRSIFEGLRGGLGSRTQKNPDAWPASKAASTINSTLHYEDLFVVQPPILGMQAFIVFTGKGTNSTEDEDPVLAEEARACAKLWCDAGVTLGFLAETAHSLLAPEKVGSSNMKDAKVVFTAIMSFCTPETAPRKRTNTRVVTRLQ